MDADTVWCATLEAGLLRYDAVAHRFTTYTRDPSGLQSNELTALALDGTGRLWAGTRAAGVNRLNPARTSWDLLSAFDGIPSDSITTLAAYGDTVWVGTTKGVALWDGTTVAGAIPDGVNPSPFSDNHVVGIVELRDSIWVATQGGVFVAQLSAVPLTWSAVNQGLFSPNPAWLASDGTRLFTVVNNVPYRFDLAAGQWRFAGNWPAISGVGRMSADHGVVVVGTQNGIYRWDPAAPPAFSGDPPGDWVAIQLGGDFRSSTSTAPDSLTVTYAMATDANGVVTYAANRNGVRALTPSCGACAPDFPPGPPGNDLINVALQGPRVYVNTYSDGVGRFDGTSWRHWYPVFCNGAECDSTYTFPIYPYALQVGANGHKWVACWSGPLEEYDDSVFPPTCIHHKEAWNEAIQAPERHSFGWATALDPDHGLWIGLESNGSTTPVTALGIDYYNAAGVYQRNFRPDNTPTMVGEQIRGLVIDGRGRLWVGFTGQGLQYYDYTPPPITTATFTFVTGTEGLFVQSLAVRGDSLWVLTTTDLRRYDGRTAKLVPGSVVSLPGAAVSNALRPLALGPDGSVWLGSEKGLRVYHPGGAIEDFNVANSPLASDLVRAVAVDPASGVAWICTSRGMNRYDPYYRPPGTSPTGALKISVYPNPVTLTGIGVSLRISGRGTGYDGAIYDLSGRVVRSFTGVVNGSIFWDGRDQGGAVVRPGVYFVRVTSGGRTGTARVAMVR